MNTTNLSSETLPRIPPLNVTAEQINDGLRIFESALEAVVK
jgi:4-aminobutyrate aminotransferase-like enzyme